MTQQGFLSNADAVQILSALAQPWRLEVVRLLVRYLPFGLPAGDIARLIAIPHNTMSTHLHALEQAGLIASRRESRMVIYAANTQRLSQLIGFLAEDCAKSALPFSELFKTVLPSFPALRETPMTSKQSNVLILCTGNSARSILAEAILNREGTGRFQAYSAGSQPKREPNPHAIAMLKDLGYDTAEFRSKSWNEFAGPDAPRMDFIITVCDSAAGEACPYWPGHPLVAHWGIPDPASVEGSDAEKRAAFMEAYRRLTARITEFVNLDLDNLDLARLKQRLHAIGSMEGATDIAREGKAAS